MQFGLQIRRKYKNPLFCDIFSESDKFFFTSNLLKVLDSRKDNKMNEHETPEPTEEAKLRAVQVLLMKEVQKHAGTIRGLIAENDEKLQTYGEKLKNYYTLQLKENEEYFNKEYNKLLEYVQQKEVECDELISENENLRIRRNNEGGSENDPLNALNDGRVFDVDDVTCTRMPYIICM